MQFQNFYSSLPPEENFFPRLQELEIYLYEGCLTHDTFKELFELYSVKYYFTLKKASIHYESQGLLYEFNFYIQKMQTLLKNEKIKPLLKRRKSRDLAEHMSHSINEKQKKIEKIRTLLKENKKERNTKELAIKLLKNFKESETNQSDILKKELNHQVENFKKRLELKKKAKLVEGISRDRGCSLPHTRLYNMIRQSAEEAENLEKTDITSNSSILKRRITVFKRTKTPERRKSILSMSTFKEEADSENSVQNSEIEDNVKTDNIRNNTRDHNESDLDLNLNFNLNKIIDQDCNLKIDHQLSEIWETGEHNMNEDIKKLEAEMEKFLDDLAEEKVNGTLEINSKYEIELKYMEDSLDLNDVNSVHTIIYNKIKADKEKELIEYYKLLDERKKIKLSEIRTNSDKIRTKFYQDKSKEIGKMKSKISREITSKIVKSFCDVSNTDSYRRHYSKTICKKIVNKAANNQECNIIDNKYEEKKY